jgi:GTP-binding protein LepA
LFQVPLAEIITDFFDQLKSRTKGYASMSFHEIGYRADKLVRLDIRINGEEAPPLATIVHRDRAHDRGRFVCNKLKELIPRQQFKVRFSVFCFLCTVTIAVTVAVVCCA